MATLSDLFLLLVLGAVVGIWLKMTRAREVAVREARRLCERHGVQLLDQSVGLRGLHLRRFGTKRRIERCYGFEVSSDGESRQSARLWMAGDAMTGFSLPTRDTRGLENVVPQEEQAALPAPPAASNVIPMRPRGTRLH
ncbi:MAG TPA: DUF3301 domain-containing protein [Luteibacter sp.]|jgi:hypothetical protein|nr:DUF3301 domain-containing protein [Luteibacter sp.]